MPRNQQQGTTLRNRNRVTNKTRLKILRGSIDADPLIVDEEEERARVIATSGVDAEDANEHHLQVAINAAAQRHSTFANDSHDHKKKKEVYIPTPDATGVVAQYEKLYPPNQWTQPSTHLRFSDTVEDTVQYALSNGYSYFMDERDNNWLEKNNQDAKGEGTSSLSAVVGTTTRASRNSKTKGKEPEILQPLHMTEDEFELILGLFERITDDRCPCLHVDTSQIPPFSEYEQVFANELPVSYFSAYVLPPFVPPTSRAVSLARLIYPHWRERRLECGGHRISAQLNDDESNDSDPYVCFRRRDSKPVRKTRASQTTITDRLLKLKSELNQAHALATELLRREETKRSSIQSAQDVWNARLKMVDVKRRQGLPPTKEEEELLFDKERTVKKQRIDRISTSGSRSRNNDSPVPNLETRLWPKERMQKIQSEINDELAKQRDRSSSWEDVAEHPLQHLGLSIAERMFSSISLDEQEDYSVPMDVDQVATREPRFLRLRSGRGGRLHIDRTFRAKRAPLSDIDPDRSSRMAERWKYDCDAVTRDELDDRFFVDDYDPRYLHHTIHLLSEDDRSCLSIDIPVPPSQPLFDPNRSVVRSLALRRGPDDMGRISQSLSLRISPPPSSSVPSSTPLPLQNRGPHPPMRIPGTPNGILPSNYITQSRPSSSQEQNVVMTHPEDTNRADSTNLLPRVGIPTTSQNIAISLSESNSFNAPAISRQHRLQTQHQSLHQPSTLPAGQINNAFGALSSNSHLGSDLTPQQIMQLKQAYATNQLASQIPATVNGAYQAMSPPSRPQSRLQTLVGISQPGGQTEPISVVANHVNLRHPPGKIPRRASPQINGDLIPSVAGHPPLVSSPLVPHSASPLLRATPANGSHLNVNGSSPNGFNVIPSNVASPHHHMLANSTIQSLNSGVLTSNSPILPPTRPPSAIPISSHHTQHINGLGQNPTF